MKTVFFDVDTQIDFLYPAGALYVPGAEQIVDRIAALNRHAGEKGLPLISTVDAHKENDPEFLRWPAHCVRGTVGQQKPATTLLDRSVAITSKQHSSFSAAGQFLLEKQALDCFTNPNLRFLLEHLAAERYVVYGVVTEICVKFAAFGLLKTGKQVQIVSDAVRSLDEQASSTMLEEFKAAGGQVIRSSELTGASA